MPPGNPELYASPAQRSGPRLLSAHPDDPNLAIYEDEAGQPFVGPASLQTGLEEDDFQAQAQEILTTPLEEEPQQLLANDGLSMPEMAASEPSPEEVGAFLEGQQLQEAGHLLTDQGRQEILGEEPAAPAPEEGASIDIPTIAGIDPRVAGVLRARGMSDDEIRRAGSRAVGITAAGGTDVTFAKQPRSRGGGRPVQQGSANTGIIGGSAVPGELLNRMDQAAEDLSQAEARKTHLERDLLGQQADVFDEQNRREAEETRRLEQIIEQRRQEAEATANEVRGFLQQMANTKINPDRFFSDRGDAARFGAAFSIAASTMAQVLAPGTPNTAMKIIDSAIDRDIQAQKLNMQNAQEATRGGINLLSQLRGLLNDEKSALLTLRSIRLQDAQNRLNGLAVRHRSQEAWVNYQKTAAEIEHRQAVALAELQKRQWEIRMQSPLSPVAIAQTVSAIEQRPLTEPVAEQTLARPQQVIGEAKEGPEGETQLPITDIEDPLFATQEQQNIDRLLQERGIDPQEARRRGTPRGTPRGRAPRRPRPLEVRHGQLIGRIQDMFPPDVSPAQINATLEQMQNQLPPGHTLAVFPSGDVQVQQVGANVAERQESDVLETREDLRYESSEPGVFVEVANQKIWNEVGSTESGRRAFQSLMELPAHVARARELLELLDDPSTLNPTSEQSGEAWQMAREMLKGFSDAAGAGVLNQDERIFFLEDRIPDVTSFTDHFREERSKAAFRRHIREIERTARSRAAGIGLRYISPSSVGTELERDAPGERLGQRDAPEGGEDKGFIDSILEAVQSIPMGRMD